VDGLPLGLSRILCIREPYATIRFVWRNGAGNSGLVIDCFLGIRQHILLPG